MHVEEACLNPFFDLGRLAAQLVQIQDQLLACQHPEDRQFIEIDIEIINKLNLLRLILKLILQIHLNKFIVLVLPFTCFLSFFL